MLWCSLLVRWLCCFLLHRPSGPPNSPPPHEPLSPSRTIPSPRTSSVPPSHPRTTPSRTETTTTTSQPRPVFARSSCRRTPLRPWAGSRRPAPVAFPGPSRIGSRPLHPTAPVPGSWRARVTETKQWVRSARVGCTWFFTEKKQKKSKKNTEKHRKKNRKTQKNTEKKKNKN